MSEHCEIAKEYCGETSFKIIFNNLPDHLSNLWPSVMRQSTVEKDEAIVLKIKEKRKKKNNDCFFNVEYLDIIALNTIVNKNKTYIDNNSST